MNHTVLFTGCITSIKAFPEFVVLTVANKVDDNGHALVTYAPMIARSEMADVLREAKEGAVLQVAGRLVNSRQEPTVLVLKAEVLADQQGFTFDTDRKGNRVLVSGAANEVTLEGNLGADPENRKTSLGVPVSNFSVALHPTSPQGKVCWVDVAAFAEASEPCVQLSKGKRVQVSGKLAMKSFRDTLRLYCKAEQVQAQVRGAN